VVDIRPDETIDDLRMGGLRLIQKRTGFRFSIDSLLLANYVIAPKRAKLADLGAGCGVIALILAARYPGIRIKAVEIQPELAELAQRNVALNGLSDRIEVECADWRRARTLFSPHSFDVVVSNPPFRRPGSGRLNPDSQKAIARHEIKGGIPEMLSAAGYLLKPRGRLFIVHLPERLPEIFSSMTRRRLAPKHIRLVHPRQGEAARHVLLHAVKDAKPGLRVAAPLFVYNPDGSYDEETREILMEK
jgi:tRNA1Val (adenine37-N6)-methyltransferase